ncbi:hypothetical protein WAI99_21610, partial [Acinetobacter baumannii]
IFFTAGEGGIKVQTTGKTLIFKASLNKSILNYSLKAILIFLTPTDKKCFTLKLECFNSFAVQTTILWTRACCGARG